MVGESNDGDESSMIPGKPTDYQFDCADMMIVGLSIGILIAIGLLAGKLSLFFISSPIVDQAKIPISDWSTRRRPKSRVLIGLTIIDLK